MSAGLRLVEKPDLQAFPQIPLDFGTVANSSLLIELMKLMEWRHDISKKKKKVERLRQDVRQMELNLVEEEHAWSDEVDRLAEELGDE